MHHATTAASTQIFPGIFRAAPIVHVAHDAHDVAAAHIDEDWEEFLSLGMQADPADLGAAPGDWQRAPVLLSY